MKVSAVIPAGGAGKRIKSDKAKQYLLLNSIPILIHTLSIFEQAKIIDEIVLTVPEGDLSYVRNDLLPPYQFTKIRSIVAGGKERQDSVRNGLREIGAETDIVVIHDAVRPFIQDKIISDIVFKAMQNGAATFGVKSKETIKETKNDNVVATIPRHNLWLTQTPQAFKYDILKIAYDKAYEDGYYGTDDASLVERIGVEVKMVDGSYENIKITTPEDLTMARALIKKDSENYLFSRSGIGYDSHRLVNGRKFILGGIEIPYEKGLEGHSDADVLLHAICDALLGAAGLADIGRQFPNTDEQYKNISSMILLDKVKNMLSEAKFSIVNIDATIIMEKPKIFKYMGKIISNIANILTVSEAAISIKAKTNEGMGLIGKSEGVAAFAIASVVKNER